MQAAGGASATMLARAEEHRRKREFKEACAAYAEAAGLGAMTADSWADYADAQASLAGKLAGEPEKAIARALQLDPQHPKALWLKASLAHEQHRYQEALTTWRQLLAVVPPGSSDARIVEANIAEAARLAKG
jgi:cytochrome c-type biogenesis protein CcmH